MYAGLREESMRILCGAGALQGVVGSMGLVTVEHYVSPMPRLYSLPHRCRYRNAWRLWSQRPRQWFALV